MQNRPVPKNRVADTVKSGIFDPNRALKGNVAFLGVSKQWDTNMVLDRIMQQESVAPYITAKVLREFVMPDPPQAYIDRIAAGWKKSGYDVKTLMRHVFMSPEFIQPLAYTSLSKNPTQDSIPLAPPPSPPR